MTPNPLSPAYNIDDSDLGSVRSWATHPARKPWQLAILLVKAAEQGCVDLVQWLIGNVMSKEDTKQARDTYGDTPLHMAASKGQTACVEILLANGLALDVLDSAGWTPVHWSAAEGHTASLRLLLEAGAPVNEMDLHGNTALQLATHGGHDPCADLLIQHGAATTTATTTTISGPNPNHDAAQ